MNDYLKITESLKKKQARRQRLKNLSFEEKIEVIELLRELQINRSLMQTQQTTRMKDDGERIKE